MTPQELLEHYDTGHLWSAASNADRCADLDTAYHHALAVRALRIARGENPRGYKIGFTNRTIWERYDVFAPIWGTVYDTTLRMCDDQGTLSLDATCQPRIEPEVVFGMHSTPKANATLQDLFESIAWVAPGFEVVQSHLEDWKFKAPDTVADGGLHARLLVGSRVPVRTLASTAEQLDAFLAAARVALHKNGALVEEGCGANVLDSPLRALHHFLAELRQCPGAPDLMAGDVVTTGTWTDAWPIQPGEQWIADFSAPLPALRIEFVRADSPGR